MGCRGEGPVWKNAGMEKWAGMNPGKANADGIICGWRFPAVVIRLASGMTAAGKRCGGGRSGLPVFRSRAMPADRKAGFGGILRRFPGAYLVMAGRTEKIVGMGIFSAQTAQPRRFAASLQGPFVRFCLSGAHGEYLPKTGSPIRRPNRKGAFGGTGRKIDVDWIRPPRPGAFADRGFPFSNRPCHTSLRRESSPDVHPGS